MQAPERLTAVHDLDAFRSREPVLDEWLAKRALASEGVTARTYVACSDGCVIGYYALAAGSVQRDLAVSKLRRNAPNPIPVIILGRLAVDQRWEGKGIGRGLLRNAILRTLHAAEIAGVAALPVHSISDEANQFYLKCGFVPSAVAPMTLMVTLGEARAGLL